MADLGFLNFGIGVDGEDLLAKALEKDKKEALEVQKILASIKIEGINFGGAESAVAKSQQAADKAAISSVKLGEAREHAASSSLIGEQKLQTEIEKTAAIQGKSAAEISSIQKQAADKAAIAQSRIATESQKAAAIQNAAADKSRVSVASLMAMERERAAKQAIYQQKLATEFQRTEAARSRAQLAMVTGERNANNAIGMTNKTMFSQKELLRQLSNAAGIYFSIYQVGAFVKNLAMVSGEFEMQRISLENILQDVDAANKLFGQIKTLAVVSPFEFKDLVGYAKQLSAFSIPVNELYDTTKRLADVSAGLGVDMGRIILAYGQVRSASVLRGQELRQFTEAGIPLVDELAKKFGELEGRVVSAGEVFDKISNRLVPFAMVKDVFNDLTSEGGKFFEMQERQSESLKGKIANLKDAYDIMLYSIGTANDGILKGGVEGITELMKNWETVATILKEIIITYGTYKATIIAVAAAEKAWTAIQITNRAAMVATAISGSKAAAMLDLLTSKLSNISKTQWWGIALAAIAALGYGIYSVYQSIHKLDNELNEIINKSKAGADASIIALDNLIIRVRNTTKGSQEYSTAIGELNRRYGEYLPNLITESDSLTDIETKLKGVTSAIYEKAKAQSYSQSVDKIEEELSDGISEAYDSAIKSLTKGINPFKVSDLFDFNTSGVNIFSKELLMSNEDANKLVASVFSQIKASPEIYKGEESVHKLIVDSMSKAFSNIKGIKIESFYDAKQLPQLKGFIEGVYEYAEAVNSLSEKQQHAYDKNKALYGETENYVSEVEKVNVKYAGLEAGINKKVYADSKNGKSTQRNTDLFEIQKDKLLELIVVYKKFGQFDLAKGVQSQFDILIQSGQKWVVTAKEIVGENKSMLSYSPQDNEQIFDYVDRIQSAYKGLKEQQKQIEGGLLAPDISKEAIPEQIKGIEALALALGFLLNTGKKEKDLIAEKFKNQIDLIKKAQALYEKYASIMSKEDAVKKVQNDGRFSKTFNPDDYKKSLESIYKLLGNSPEQKKVKEALRDLFSDIDYSEAKKSTDKLLETVNKEIDDYKKKYDFYKTILGITGDESLSQKMAFDVGFIGNPLELMKDKFKYVSGEEFVLGMDTSKMTASAKKMYDDIFSYQEESSQKAYESLLKMQDDLGKQDFSLFGKGWELDLSKIARDVFQKNKEINDREQKAAQELANAKGALNESVAKAAYDNIIRLGNLERENNKKVADEKIKDLAKSALNDKISDAGVSDIFSNLNEATFRQLDRAKKALEDISKTELSPELIEQFKAVSKNEKEAEESAKSFLDILKKLAGVKLDDTKEAKRDKTINEVKDVALAAADGIGQLGDSLYSLGEASGDAGLMEIGDMLGTISSLATDIAGALSGNPQDIIKSVFSIATKFLEAEARHKKALKEINDGILAQQRAYNILLIEQNLAYEKGNSIFGNDAYGKALNGIKEYKNVSSQLKNALNGLNKVKVVTGHKKTGFMGWGKGKDTYTGILSLYPRLIKANGEFDAELAKNILNTRKLDEASKNSLQNMINLAEKQKEAYTQMNDYLTGLFGDLGSSMSDALVDAFKNGTDASESFYKSVSSMLEKLAKDMVYSMTIGTVIDKYKDKIGDINKNSNLTDEQRFAELAKLVSSFTKDVLAKQGEANDLYKKFQEEAKKNNIDIFNPDSDKKEGLSKGIAGVTEDTANLLASYLNAMRADLSNQKIYFQKIIDSIIPMSNNFALQVAELKKIEANTYRTANNTEENVKILNRIEGVLNSITRQGSGKKVNI